MLFEAVVVSETVTVLLVGREVGTAVVMFAVVDSVVELLVTLLTVGVRVGIAVLVGVGGAIELEAKGCTEQVSLEHMVMF